MSRRVIELVRVSTEGQAAEDRGGIPAQREINRRTARTYGLNIVMSVEIIDVSGAAVLKSPEMQKLLLLIEDPEIHGVVAKEFSRLMRPENFNDFYLLQQFIDTETVLYLPDGPIDLGSKSGRFMGTVRAAMAGLERREIIERMQDGKEALRRAGKHASGSNALPFGVTYSKEHGWAYTTEAEKVKQAFALFLSGETSYTEIGRRLNLPRTSVRFILENPIYTGWRIYDEKRDTSSRGYRPGPDGRQSERRKIKRPEDEVIKVHVMEGLMSEEDFARVQQLIELKRQNHWRVRNETVPHYTYNGFLKCGDAGCGGLVYTHSSKQDFYVCKSHHPRERRRRASLGLQPCGNRYMLRKKLESRIDDLLGRRLTERKFLAQAVREYNQQLQSSKTSSALDQQSVKTKLQALANKRERVLETYFEGVINKEERNGRIEEIERDMKAYQDLLTESGPAVANRENLDLKTVLDLLAPFIEWEFLDREAKRQILQFLCPEIFVYRYEIKRLVFPLAGRGTGCHEGSRRRTARSRFRARPCR